MLQVHISRRSLVDRRKLVILEHKIAGRQLLSSSAPRVLNPGSSGESKDEVNNDTHNERLVLGRRYAVNFKSTNIKCNTGRFMYNDNAMTTLNHSLSAVGRLQQRYFSSEYPNHLVVGLPSLSPVSWRRSNCWTFSSFGDFSVLSKTF